MGHVSLGLSVYTGGNLIIATLLSAVLCGIGFSLVWGILGGSMPRSGGEYIYNSRIISPPIGIAESFGNAFVWIMWIYVLAPWTINPGMVMVFQFLDMPAAADALSTTWGLFLGATVVNFLGLLFMVFGIKVFARAQKVITVLRMIGAGVILLVFTFTSRDQYVQAWNGLAGQYGSLDYNGFLAAAKGVMEEAGKLLPTTWNWFDTLGVMVAGSWLFAYSYCITFIAGEVEPGAINARYVARLFADDWGFYHSATTNLAKVKAATGGVAALSDEQRLVIYAKADQLLERIEAEPKSGKWKKRAQLGTKKPWYNEVSDWA